MPPSGISFQAHLATQVCTGITQKQFLFKAGHSSLWSRNWLNISAHKYTHVYIYMLASEWIVTIWNRARSRALVQNQHTRKLISARNVSYKLNIVFFCPWRRSVVERLVCTIHHSILHFCNIKSRTQLPKELDHGRLTSIIIHAQKTVSAEDCQTAHLTRPQTNLQ